MRDPCGPNAFGVPGDPVHHVCNCACIDGYEGNPKTGCTAIVTPPPPPTDFPKPGIEVNCLATGVAVKVRMTDTNFHGVMYVKGHSHDPRCRKAVEPGQGVRPIDFEVDFDTCGLFHYQVSDTKFHYRWEPRG